MTQAPSFTLENFEGPLDLLLHLIRSNKLDILQIPITELLRQYMEYLNGVRDAQLEVTADFVEMASRLVRIKTNMMLPRHEEADEADTLQGLTADLVEYSLCKQLADRLRERSEFQLSHVRAPMKIKFDSAYSHLHAPRELAQAYFAAVRRGERRQPPSERAFDGIVRKRFVSVESRAMLLLRALLRQGKLRLSDVYRGISDRSELVATFLAVLEMVKTKRITLDDDNEVVELQRGGKKHGAKRAEGGDRSGAVRVR